MPDSLDNETHVLTVLILGEFFASVSSQQIVLEGKKIHKFKWRWNWDFIQNWCGLALRGFKSAFLGLGLVTLETLIKLH